MGEKRSTKGVQGFTGKNKTSCIFNLLVLIYKPIYIITHCSKIKKKTMHEKNEMRSI